MTTHRITAPDPIADHEARLDLVREAREARAISPEARSRIDGMFAVPKLEAVTREPGAGMFSGMSPPNNRRPFEQDEIDLIIRMCEAGETLKTIAAAMPRRNLESIRYRANVSGFQFIGVGRTAVKQ